MQACLIALAAMSVAAGPLYAQERQSPTLHLEADVDPLADLLRELSRQSGVDIVFAERTVSGRFVSGRFIGDDFELALRTMLRSSGLRGERVRTRQYVIVPDIGLGASVPQPDFRGTLEGVVMDVETGEALPGAHVMLSGLQLGTVTNTAGYFALAGLPAGDYRVRVSFVGYRAAELDLSVYPASKLDRHVVRLTPQTVLSGAVTIEGNDGERGDLEIVPGGTQVDVRSAAAMPVVLGEGDLLAALEWVPGVARSAEAGGELIVRGADAQYNRYLLDGAPVIHPWHTFGLFSIFQPEPLKSVRLHKGSFPAEHGGGLSAVLDIEMRDGMRQRPGGMVSVSPVSVRGYVESPLGSNASLMLTGRRTWLSLLLNPRLRLDPADGLPAFTFSAPFSDVAARDRQDVGYFFYDGGAKLSWRVADGHQMSLSAYEGGDRLRATAPFSTLLGSGAGSDGTSPGADSLNLSVNHEWGNRVISGRYHGLISPSLFTTATAYYSTYGAREETLARPTTALESDSEYRVRFSEVGLRVDVDHYASLAHQVRAGFRVVGRYFSSSFWQEEHRHGDPYLRREQSDRVRALELVGYVQDTWQPAPGWQLQPGLRVEYFTLGRHVSVNPRLHVRRALHRDVLFARAGISRQTQSHHRVRDRRATSLDLASERWVLANERVRPASAWQGAVGMEWAASSRITLSAELFGRQLSDILLVEPAGGLADGTHGDEFVAGSGRAFGVEIAAQLERDQWRSGLSYSLSRSQERLPGGSFRPARYDAPHQIEAFVIGGHGSWTMAVTSTVRSGYPFTAPIGHFTISDPLGDDQTFLYRPEVNNDRLPVYARVDLSVGYAFDALGLQWDAQAQAYNVLNRRNAVGSRWAAQTASVQEAEVIGLPLLPMISLKAHW